MADSALLGHPPNTKDDSFIVLGFFRAIGIPEIAWNKTSVIPVRAPPGAPHDTRANELIVSVAIVITLIVMITGTRLSLRLFKKELHWGSDDWAIILAMFSVVAFLGIALAAAVNHGAGKHLYDLTYANFNTYLSLMWVGQVLFYPAVAMIKISIVLFNRRLTGLTSRKWMIFHNTLLVLLILYIAITILINVFICVPFPKNFQLLNIGKMSKPPRWIQQKPIVPAFSAIHIAFDFILLSVPLIVLTRMKMASAKKIRLLFLFSIGAISTVGAVMRSVVQPTTKAVDITCTPIFSPILTSDSLHSPMTHTVSHGKIGADSAYGTIDKFPDYFRWSIVDLVFAITAASLPTLNCLVPKRWDGSRGSTPNVVSPNANSGSLGSEPKVLSAESEVRESSFKSSNSSTDEEGAFGKHGRDTKTATQPDWNDYHPEIKVLH